jgi:hypothetical protein
VRECLVHSRNAVAVKNAIVLENCFQARCWHDSAAIFRQLRGLGNAYAQILSLKGIKRFNDLRALEPEMLETWCHRNSPFGYNLLKDLQQIPRYELKITSQSTINHSSKAGVQIALTARISVLSSNGSANRKGQRKVWTVFLATAHGVVFDYQRFP